MYIIYVFYILYMCIKKIFFCIGIDHIHRTMRNFSRMTFFLRMRISMYHLIDTCFISEHAGTARVFFIRYGGQSFFYHCFLVITWRSNHPKNPNDGYLKRTSLNILFFPLTIIVCFCPSILPKSTMRLGHHSSFRCDWGRRRCLV